MSTNKVPVYRYIWTANEFNFVPIGTYCYADPESGLNYSYTFAYKVGIEHSIMLTLPTLIVARCEIVEYIDEEEIIMKLLICLFTDLGYGSQTRQICMVQHADKCEASLQSFIMNLIRKRWSIQNCKECLKHFQDLKMKRCVLLKFENMVDEVFVDEANKRFLNAKAKCIQKYWRNAISNPNHPCCQRRLAFEANELWV